MEQTHKTNFEQLKHIDGCTYPKVNVKVDIIRRDNGDVIYDYYFGSKVVVVRGDNSFFVPVEDRYQSNVNDLEGLLNRFKTMCVLVRDKWDALEGKDVLVNDYYKITDCKN